MSNVTVPTDIDWPRREREEFLFQNTYLSWNISLSVNDCVNVVGIHRNLGHTNDHIWAPRSTASRKTANSALRTRNFQYTAQQRSAQKQWIQSHDDDNFSTVPGSQLGVESGQFVWRALSRKTLNLSQYFFSLISTRTLFLQLNSIKRHDIHSIHS